MWIFSPIPWVVVLSLSWWSLLKHKVHNFGQIQFIMFFFCGSCLLCFFLKKSKSSKTRIKTLPKQGNKDFSPVFSSGSFIFLARASRGMTHFDLMYMVWGKFHHCCLHVDIKYFQQHLLKRSSSHWNILAPFLKIIWPCLCGYVSGVYFVLLFSFDYVSVLVPVSILLIIVTLLSVLKSVSVKFYSICILFKDILFQIFAFPYIFYDKLLLTMKRIARMEIILNILINVLTGTSLR